MLRRIWIVPPRVDVNPRQARDHWEGHHGALFADTPGLLHYRQNRPVDSQWADGTARCCSETWFADAESERAAFRSDFYDNVIAPDDASFAQRDAAWWATVDGPEAEPPSPDAFRVLWFDADPPPDLPWVMLGLDRPVPAPGTGRSLYVAEVDDPESGLALVRDARGIALLCRSVLVSADA